MKKKILISSVVIIMILSMSTMLFAGCKSKFKPTPLEDFEKPESYIGATMATDDMFSGGLKPINNKMEAFEMLQVGMENFYNANYAIIEYNGGVNMTLMGTIKVDQVVQSTKVRNGVGDASGNNAKNATYFADNKSHSAFAKIYERFYITPNSYTRKAGGDIKFEKPNEKKGIGRLGAWTVGSWANPQDYETLNALVTENCNNPTILWMYDLKEENIVGQFPVDENGVAAKPIYDPESKTYRFSLSFEPEKSTVEYLKVMKVQLETNAGMPIDGLGFNELILQVVMWENGTIKSISVVEQYQMKMMLTGIPIDSAVKLTATQLFSYDSNEAGYVIADHIDKFNNNTI